MPDYVRQRSIEIRVDCKHPDIIGQVRSAVERQLHSSETPIRFAVTNSDGGRWTCEVGTLTSEIAAPGIFDFNAKSHDDNDSFNVIMLVPTGIGARVGGHAGDATPAATLLSSVCDTLITHPNVLNASDIIHITPNTLYVEGSLITQLMMGTIGLRRRRNNRLLVLIQSHEDELFTNAAINSVNAARASYGLNAKVAEIDPKLRMTSEYAPSGAAAGTIECIEYVYEILDTRLTDFDAVAITSVVDLPLGLHESYYQLVDDVVNPWGGVEAMLTHAVSLRYCVPSAHAPMLESRKVAEADYGLVDPRTAAEVISLAFLQCVLRGLKTSPTIDTLSSGTTATGIQLANISCLVIPDGCIGLPTLSALVNGIPVVAVRGNTNRMRNDLDSLPWQPMQFFRVENYLEATGVVAALKAGICPSSVTRPLEPASVTRLVSAQANVSAAAAERLHEIPDYYVH